MNKLRTWARNFAKDESGQGTAEYVLLLVIIVGVIFIFKDRIKGWLTGTMDNIGGKIDGIGAE